MSLATLTIAEEEVPDAQQCVEGEVACEQTHQPIGGEHEWLHAVALQVSVGGRTRPLQDPAQHGCVKQDPVLRGHTAHGTQGGGGVQGHTADVLVLLCSSYQQLAVVPGKVLLTDLHQAPEGLLGSHGGRELSRGLSTVDHRSG